jgi:hypothetical protein
MEVQRIPIDRITDHAICEAKCYLNMILPQKPHRLQARERLRLILNELTLRSLDRQDLGGEKRINEVVAKAYSDLDYEKKAKDMEATSLMFQNMSNMMEEYDLTINGSVMPIEIAYGGHIVTSVIDCVVDDKKRGYRYPVVVDFSQTKYDPQYNPVIYRCQPVADYFNLDGSNTQVCVLSISAAKRWFFEYKKYGDLLRLSISERIAGILEERFPLRIGWWCAGCDYRGICMKLVEVD